MPSAKFHKSLNCCTEYGRAAAYPDSFDHCQHLNGQASRIFGPHAGAMDRQSYYGDRKVKSSLPIPSAGLLMESLFKMTHVLALLPKTFG